MQLVVYIMKLITNYNAVVSMLQKDMCYCNWIPNTH